MAKGKLKDFTPESHREAVRPGLTCIAGYLESVEKLSNKVSAQAETVGLFKSNLESKRRTLMPESSFMGTLFMGGGACGFGMGALATSLWTTFIFPQAALITLGTAVASELACTVGVGAGMAVDKALWIMPLPPTVNYNLQRNN